MEDNSLLSKDSFVEAAEYLAMAQLIAKQLKLRWRNHEVVLAILQEVYQVESCRTKWQNIMAQLTQASPNTGCCKTQSAPLDEEGDGFEVIDEND